MSWDNYFMNLCDAVAKNSKCLLRQVGAVIVTPDRAIVATGYNGPPRGVIHCDMRNPNLESQERIDNPVCPRRALGYGPGEGRHLCPAAHAEMNAIWTAAREGWRLKGCVIYINDFPCAECLKGLIQVGLGEVVCVRREGRPLDRGQGFLLKHSKIKVREFHKGTMPGPEGISQGNDARA